MAEEKIATQNTHKTTYDNQIRMVDTTSGNSAETFIFGADQVFVGKENKNEVEIATTQQGFKYERNKIDGVEVYNLHKQAHHCWLMIDLETGGRGWYPGSKEVVDINNAVVYVSPNDTSAVLGNIETGTYDKLDLVYGTTTESTGKIVYCKIQYDSSTIGYVKNSTVVKTYFIDRTN